MANIALIDDNKDQRETFRKLLSIYLKKKNSDLNVIDIFPFKNIEDYYHWIIDRKIVALIFDEKLHNDSTNGYDPVDYNGTDIVVKIRQRFKDIPIFSLTNFNTDEELDRNFHQFEYILSKSDFTDKHVEIILRACQRYFDDNITELSRFDEVTRKIAAGKGSLEDFEILQALQVKLQIPYCVELKDREDWLLQFEKQLIELEKIKIEIERNLNT
jgi:CheY-like chemotaxis protein